MRKILHLLGLPSWLGAYWNTEYWILVLLIGWCCMRVAWSLFFETKKERSIFRCLRNNVKSIPMSHSLLISFALSVFYAIILPAQTYMGNADMFEYAWSGLAVELLVSFCALFLLAYLSTIVAGAFFGRSWLVVLLMIPVWGYIQLTVLSIGIPQLNGELWLLLRATIRDMVEGLIFVFFVIMMVRLRRFLLRHFVLIVGALLVMSVAFLFDGIGAGKKSPEPTEFDDGFCPPFDMVKSVSFTTNKNVLVIILDSASGELAEEIMKENVRLKDHFRGFVQFANNIGMHDCTMRAVPAMATGRYLEKDVTMFENEASFWSEGSAIVSYKRAGYDMYVENGASGTCFTNMRRTFSPVREVPRSECCLLQCTKSSPYVSLLDVMKYRMVRYGRKHGVVWDAFTRGDAATGTGRESVFREEQVYPVLERSVVTNSATAKCFCWIHTEGAHVPILVDQEGKRLPFPREDREAIKGCQHHLLKLVSGLMDALVQKGVYDQSLIVLTADHGIVAQPKSALLWVKPIGSRAEFATSRMPTTHSKICELLKKSVDSNLDVRQIGDALRQDVRRLRPIQVSPEKWWQFGLRKDTYEIIYDKDGEQLSRENLGEFIIN